MEVGADEPEAAGPAVPVVPLPDPALATPLLGALLPHAASEMAAASAAAGNQARRARIAVIECISTTSFTSLSMSAAFYGVGGNTSQTQAVNLLLLPLRHPQPMRFASAMRLPRRTVRLRLTLLYGALFLVSGAVLLAITYVLFQHATSGNTFLFTSRGASPPAKPFPGGTSPSPQQLQSLAQRGLAAGQEAISNAIHQRAAEQHQLLVQSGIALGIMAIISIVLGWLVAGRVLRPLRTMTAKTRRISEANLDERLDVRGPSDELKELGDTIDDLLGRLEAAFDAQRRFVANASHELRTPLAMMRTSLDVATGKPEAVPAQVTALGDKFREGLDQADRLLESFLTLARAQNGTAIDRTAVPVAVIVARALDAQCDATEAGRIEVHKNVEDVVVTGSETLLSRMIENLLDNALRHNEPGGWMSVRAYRENDVAWVIVENGGPRLDEDRVRELAQPFRRLGADRTGADGGVGLGLSIVAAIAAAHGGQLELTARPAGGLRAAVELRCESPVAIGTAATSSPAGSDAAAYDLGASR